MNETISNKYAYVGIDISSESLQVHLIDKNLSFTNDGKGIKKLVKVLSGISNVCVDSVYTS